jgi:hypothetical protein
MSNQHIYETPIPGDILWEFVEATRLKIALGWNEDDTLPESNIPSDKQLRRRMMEIDRFEILIFKYIQKTNASGKKEIKANYYRQQSNIKQAILLENEFLVLKQECKNIASELKSRYGILVELN